VDGGSRVYILPERIGKAVPVRDVDRGLILAALGTVKEGGKG
jgi:hypothetical protein